MPTKDDSFLLVSSGDLKFLFFHIHCPFHKFHLWRPICWGTCSRFCLSIGCPWLWSISKTECQRRKDL